MVASFVHLAAAPSTGPSAAGVMSLLVDFDLLRFCPTAVLADFSVGGGLLVSVADRGSCKAETLARGDEEQSADLLLFAKGICC